MNISEAARATGLKVKALRYYETVGLVIPERGQNGYRLYSNQQARELVFLRRARQFGFSLKDCEKLLALLRDPGRRSHEVHLLAGEKLAEMDHRLRELSAMRTELASLLQSCPDNDDADCPIIDKLAGGDSDEIQCNKVSGGRVR